MNVLQHSDTPADGVLAKDRWRRYGRSLIVNLL